MAQGVGQMLGHMAGELGQAQSDPCQGSLSPGQALPRSNDENSGGEDVVSTYDVAGTTPNLTFIRSAWLHPTTVSIMILTLSQRNRPHIVSKWQSQDSTQN